MLVSEQIISSGRILEHWGIHQISNIVLLKEVHCGFVAGTIEGGSPFQNIIELSNQPFDLFWSRIISLPIMTFIRGVHLCVASEIWETQCRIETALSPAFRATSCEWNKPHYIHRVSEQNGGKKSISFIKRSCTKMSFDKIWKKIKENSVIKEGQGE